MVSRAMQNQNVISGNYGGNNDFADMTTEYGTMYHNWPSQVQSIIFPPSNGEFICNSDGKHEMKTMYDETYLKHPHVQRTMCIRPSPARSTANKNEKLFCVSTYKDNFRHGKGEKRTPFRPPQTNHTNDKNRSCEKTSVNQSTYKLYSSEEVLGARRNPIIITQEKDGVFPTCSQADVSNMRTTVQENFNVPGTPQKRKPIIPHSHGLQPPGTHIEMVTTNRADYTRKMLDPSVGIGNAPAHLRNKNIAKASPFNNRSTFQGDYIKHPLIQRPKSFKPLQRYVVSDLPFGTQTSYSNDYKPKPPQEPPKPKIIQGNIRLSGKYSFGKATQYTDEFNIPPTTYRRPMLCKPKSNHTSSGRFFGDTSYNSNYLKFDVNSINQRPNFKPVRRYSCPKIPFQIESTAHSHYKGEYAPPSKICKPTTKSFLDDI